MFVYANIIYDLRCHFGPKPEKVVGWNKYAWKLIAHLLGEEENVRKLKGQAGAGSTVDVILGEKPLLAVMGAYLISTLCCHQ